MNCAEIFKRLEAFGFGKLQSLEALLSEAERQGITVQSLRNCIIERKEAIRAAVGDVTVIRRVCPECGDTLRYRPIRQPKGRRNLYGYTWHWVCAVCSFEEYSFESRTDVVTKYGVKKGASY